MITLSLILQIHTRPLGQHLSAFVDRFLDTPHTTVTTLRKHGYEDGRGCGEVARAPPFIACVRTGIDTNLRWVDRVIDELQAAGGERCTEAVR